MVKNSKNVKRNDWFDMVVLWVAIIEPLSTIPQIIRVYTTKDAADLSLLSWGLFAAASVIWLVYGLRIKSLPLIASSVMWIATELLLMVGIVLYS